MLFHFYFCNNECLVGYSFATYRGWKVNLTWFPLVQFLEEMKNENEESGGKRRTLLAYVKQIPSQIQLYPQVTPNYTLHNSSVFVQSSLYSVHTFHIHTSKPLPFPPISPQHGLNWIELSSNSYNLNCSCESTPKYCSRVWIWAQVLKRLF